MRSSSSKMPIESCLPQFQAITFKNYSVWMALKKKPALSLQWTSTSYSLRRGRSDRSNLATETRGQNKLARPNEVQQTIFIDMDYTRCFVSRRLCLAAWRVFKGFHLGTIRRTRLSPLKQSGMMQTQTEFPESLVVNRVKQTQTCTWSRL